MMLFDVRIFGLASGKQLITGQALVSPMHHFVMEHLISERSFGKKLPLRLMVFVNGQYMALAYSGDEKQR